MSVKAISEKAALFYGGGRVFPFQVFATDDPDGLGCCVDNPVDVQIAQTSTTTATAQGSGRDFDLLQYCGDDGDPVFASVTLSGGVGSFAIPKNEDPVMEPPVVACPPAGFAQACIGYLVLDLRSTQASDTKWEAPEEFAVQFQSASVHPPQTGQQTNFEIGDSSDGLVWMIQDECECRSLFQYDLPDNEVGAPGTPCVQLASEFASVGGNATALNCNPLYYKNDGPVTIKGAVMSNYVPQNSPCAAAETVVEDSYFDLLLGYIDRNAMDGNSVGGSFYEGLGVNDYVEVKLRIKNKADWNPPAGCDSSSSNPPPASYAHYATPQEDFVIETKVPDTGTDCSNGDFVWQPIAPDTGTTGTYSIRLSGNDVFSKKLRGIRIRALEDDASPSPGYPNEGPEIVHIQVDSALRYSQVTTAVDIGWSSAFRLVIRDE